MIVESMMTGICKYGQQLGINHYKTKAASPDSCLETVRAQDNDNLQVVATWLVT